MNQSNQALTRPTSTIFSLSKKVLVLAILCFTTFSCKKSDLSERDYGYAKVTVKCDKCSVSYTSSGQLNSFTVEGSSAVNYIRYRADFSLDINIQSLNANQPLSLSVYSRSGKQVLLNTTVKNVNEVWNSKVLIP